MGGTEYKPVGLTKDTGFQAGARKTIPVSAELAWKLITSSQGVDLWLGKSSPLVFKKGASYTQPDGTSGEVRVSSPGSHLRVTWHPPGWPRSSTIQVRIIPKDEKSIIAFHQEHIPGAEERKLRIDHFKKALENLQQLVNIE